MSSYRPPLATTERAPWGLVEQQDLANLVESHSLRPLEGVVNVDHSNARSLSNNPNINCQAAPQWLSSLGYPFICFNYEKLVTSVDVNETPFVPIQGCYTDNVTNAQRGECGSFCALVASGVGQCNYCAWLESGEFAYDCSNIFPEGECAMRNGKGECEEFTQWACLQTPGTGKGYICEIFNIGDFPSPAFAFDDVRNLDIQTYLYCANDVSGLDGVDLCQDPLCSLQSPAAGVLDSADQLTPSCDSCKVLPKTDDAGNENSVRFSYDCLETFPDLECPILRTDGTCQSVPMFTPPEPENTTWWNVPSSLVESPKSIVDTEDDLDGTGWVLRNMDPTGFNGKVMIGLKHRLPVGADEK